MAQNTQAGEAGAKRAPEAQPEGSRGCSEGRVEPPEYPKQYWRCEPREGRQNEQARRTLLTSLPGLTHLVRLYPVVPLVPRSTHRLISGCASGARFGCGSASLLHGVSAPLPGRR
jgi:hypothetical protein